MTANVYRDTALAGVPVTHVVNPTSLSVALASTTGPFSAELVGTVVFPAGGGRFAIDCTFGGTVGIGFVWLADHQVCDIGGCK